MPGLVTVNGLGEKQRALLKAAGQDVKKELKKTYKKIGEELVPQIAGRAPRRTGRLAGSVRAIAQVAGPGIRIGGGASAPYAGVVIFGSQGGRKRNAFPYQVIDPQLPHIVDQIIEALDAVAEGINNT